VPSRGGVFQADAFDVDGLIISLESKTAQDLGTSEIECVDLARRVLEHWERHMAITP